MNAWFVVAEGYHEDELVVVVVGPFNNDIDAKSYAIDMYDENGWTEVEARLLTNQEAKSLAPENPIINPYRKTKRRHATRFTNRARR